MAHTLTKHREVRDEDTGYRSTDESPVVSEEKAHRQRVAARVVWFIAGVILTLLAFRFVLVFFGANAGNGFVDFIYSVSRPLVEPFYGIFNYDYISGKATVEVPTLVAMAVYTVIAAGIAKLVTITRE